MKTGEMRNKNSLPATIYIDDFNGIVSINSFYIPWGPYGSTYRIYGLAAECN